MALQSVWYPLKPPRPDYFPEMPVKGKSSLLPICHAALSVWHCIDAFMGMSEPKSDLEAGTRQIASLKSHGGCIKPPVVSCSS